MKENINDVRDMLIEHGNTWEGALRLIHRAIAEGRVTLTDDFRLIRNGTWPEK